MKNTFDNSTQDYPGVRHEQEFIPKNLAVVRCPSFSYPMPSIRPNKENVSLDLL